MVKQKDRVRLYLIAVVVFFVLVSSSEAWRPKWRTIWRDDFNGRPGKLPKRQNWIIDVGTSYPGGPANWGTGEIQTYTNSTDNVSLDGKGNLRITPLKDSSGGWTSSRIETRRTDFKPRKGGMLAFEGRIQMPNVTGEAAMGYWPAFWTLGSPYRGNYWNWPSIGEYDIMENVNGIDRVWGVLHCGVSPGGPCQEKDGLGNSRPCPGSSCQSAFHVYRFEWDDRRHEFRWYVDRQRYHRITKDQIGEDTWNKMTEHGHFVLLNVAMGGAFPNGVSGSDTPIPSTEPGHPMLVDYVAVYSFM